MSDDTVPKEFNDANIRAAREYKARAEAAEAEIERLREENRKLSADRDNWQELAEKWRLMP